MTVPQPAYALDLSDAERERYRMMAARAREREGADWERFGVRAAARVVDLGCGPGAVLVFLASMVGAEGSVIGVEPDAGARAAAGAAIEAAGLANATVRGADGADTGITPGSVDVVMIRHVLFHAGERPQRIVDHAASLLVPGGHLYLVDTDATAMRITVADADYMEQAARYQEFQRSRGNTIDAGVWLGEYITAAGLELVERSAWIEAIPGQVLTLGGPPAAARREMRAAGYVADNDVRRWEAAQQRVAASPGAMLLTTLHRAVGCKSA